MIFRTTVITVLLTMALGRVVLHATPEREDQPRWIPLAEETWLLLIHAPQVHFESAKENFKRKAFKTAAAEIRKGNVFLKLQRDNLIASINDLEQLARKTESGKIKSLMELDEIFEHAALALDEEKNWLLLEDGSFNLFEKEYQDHLKAAKISLRLNDNESAASELRKATSYLKLRAKGSDRKFKKELQKNIKEVRKIEKSVRKGTVKDFKYLNSVIRKIEEIFEKSGR